MKVDREYIRQLMKDRREYERMLLEVRGLFQKTQIIFQQRNPILSVSEIVDVSSEMSEEDRKEIIGICEDVGEYPG